MTAEDDPEARIRELERPLSVSVDAAELTASGPRGNRPRITVALGALAAVAAAAAAAAAFLVTDGSTSTTPGRPAVPRGADAPTSSRVPAAAPPATTAPGETLMVLGAEQSKTLVCAGNDVSVSGVRNTVVLTGPCAGLTVSGIGNVITVDSTPTITTSGIDNRITYRSGDPEVSTSGLGNIVERG